MPRKKGSDGSSGDATDESEPETVLWSDDSSTADTEEYISDAEPGVASDWSSASAGQSFRHWLRATVPNIHRGPQQNSLHVSFNHSTHRRGEMTYKLQVSYGNLYRVKEFAQALSDVSRLFAEDPARRYLTIAKTFNNPRKGSANVFVYFLRSTPVDALMALVTKLRVHFKAKSVGSIFLKESSADAKTLGWL